MFSSGDKSSPTFELSFVLPYADVEDGKVWKEESGTAYFFFYVAGCQACSSSTIGGTTI